MIDERHGYLTWFDGWNGLTIGGDSVWPRRFVELEVYNEVKEISP